MCNTNIPYNAAEVLANPPAEPPTNFLKYSTLKTYLSKAINLLRALIPRSDFWKDEEYLQNISGAKFEKACRRRQQLKNDNFGEVARIGLYMRTPYSSHTGDAGSDWINQVSANSVCEEMFKKTIFGDTFNSWAEGRLAFATQKQAVGRGGEPALMTVPTMSYDPYLQCCVLPWMESKTVRSYMCPFVSNKSDWATDVLHAFGTYAVCARGLRRTPDQKGRISPYLL